MDEDFKNINLLPDELRKDEEKLKQAPEKEAPVEFHVPKKQEPVLVPPTPKLVEDIKLPVPEIEKKSKALKPVKVSNKPSFWKSLFKKKKKVFNDPTNEILDDLPQNIVNSNLSNKLPPQTEGIQHEELVLEGMDVNLIPEGTYLLPNKKIYITLGLYALAAIFFAVLAYTGLIIYGLAIDKQSARVTLNVEEGEKVLVNFEQTKQEAELISKKLEVVDALLKVHIYWTKVFSVLEKLTIDDVYYSNISASADGLVALSANTNSYTDVARQYKVFQNAPEIANVDISGATGNNIGGSISFNVSLELSGDIFFSY